MLAQRVGLNVEDLRRFLRLAITRHIFYEPRKNIISHNAVSRVLIDVPSSNDWLGLVCEEMLPSGIHAVEALRKWPNSHDPAFTGYALASDSGESLFHALGHNPEKATRFMRAMGFLQAAQPCDVSFLLENVPWTKSTCPATVVDIGGSLGTIGSHMLETFPSIGSWMVQDMENVIERASIPVKHANRLSFHQSDLFAIQAIVGADIYFLRSVLHNWSDEKAIQILRNQVPAMKAESRIILNEICLPEPGKLPSCQEQIMRYAVRFSRMLVSMRHVELIFLGVTIFPWSKPSTRKSEMQSNGQALLIEQTLVYI